MNSINIETSTSVCSLSLTVNGEPLLAYRDDTTHNHAKQLPLFADTLLKEVQSRGLKIDAVALSKGPGSYTGLRIGTAFAKGLCYGLNVPLLAVDTLRLMAQEALSQTSAEVLCPMIDARRMEVYCCLFTRDMNVLSPVEAKVIDADAFCDILSNRTLCCFGDGADKCKAVLQHPNISFLDNIVPDAKNMGCLAEEAYQAGRKEDIAYFDPFYLKEYHAIHSVNKVLQHN